MEEIKDKMKELEELLEKISKSMDMTREKKDSIDTITNELNNETRPIMIEKMQEEIEQRKNDRIEFDEMTKNALINAKKLILEIKEDSEKSYQDKLLDIFKRKQEIQKKLFSLKEKEISQERLEIAKKYADIAMENVNIELEEFQKNHIELKEKINRYEIDILENALEIGVEQEISSVSINEKNSNESKLIEQDEEKQEETKQDDKKQDKEKQDEEKQDETIDKRIIELENEIKEKVDAGKTRYEIKKELLNELLDIVIDGRIKNLQEKFKNDETSVPSRNEIIKLIEKDFSPATVDELLSNAIDSKIDNLLNLRKTNPQKDAPQIPKIETQIPKADAQKAKVESKISKVEPKVQKVEPKKQETDTTKFDHKKQNDEKMEMSDIKIVPFFNEIQYSYKGHFPKYHSDISFNYNQDQIEYNVKVLKNLLKDNKIDYIAQSIDPNILKWIIGDNYNIQVEDYLNILNGRKTDVKIFYDLKDIYDSDLNSKQIKNAIKIAKNAEKTSRGAVQVEQDPLLKRIYGNVRKKVAEFNVKLLNKENKDIYPDENYYNASRNTDFVPKSRVNEKEAIKKCRNEETSKDIYNIPVYYLEPDDKNERQ